MTRYNPDYAVPPAETLMNVLKEQGKGDDLKSVLGFSDDETEQFKNGDMKLTEELAHTISDITGIDKSFWLKREHLYRERTKKAFNRRTV